MDWFSWLSKTGLEPTKVYEYGLIFAQNELEEEDMFYFNHEFLQSMGICIAKHRLQILKLIRKEKGRPVAKLVAAINKTKKSIASYMRTLTHRQESALAVVPLPTRPIGFGTRWKSGMMMKRNNKKLQDRLLLTNGIASDSTTVYPANLPSLDGFSSPVVYHFQKDQKMNDDDVNEDGYWSAAVEEIKWDTMFQDLKPN